ncbi:MAG: hypothetical protein WC707_07135 [Candidatus Babeliaceae bacterium]|jgi:hypothetical protein
MDNIKEILKDRGSIYGDYQDVSRVSQHLKSTMRSVENWASLDNQKKESFEMIANKIARILCGDPKYIDNYRDIIGYIQLIIDSLSYTDGASDVVVSKKTRVKGVWQ